jgi:hypothetical protein
MVAAMCAPARADTGTAKALADEADRLASGGDYVAGALKYRAAFGEDPRPEYICNVGVAYYKALDFPAAHRYLEQCLAAGTQLDAAFIANVHEVVAAVEQKLVAGDFTPVDIAVVPASAATMLTSDTGQRPYDEPIVGSRRVWVPFGVYRVTVTGGGYIDHHQQMMVHDRAPLALRVKLERPRTPPSKIPPVATGVAALVIGGLAAGMYLTASNDADTARQIPDVMTYSTLHDSYKKWQTRSYVALGAATACAAVSGYLWYRATRHPRARVEVEANAQAATITIGANW